MKYFVRLGSATHEVILDGETVTFDGTSLRAHLEILEGTPVQLVAIGEQVHRILIRRGAERGSYDLSIDGYRVAVEALDERARTIRDMSAATDRPVGPAHLAAPMPGMIVRLNVKEGDQVRVGQGLVVMEAMKMENELRAAASGTVLRILVSPGNVVEKGAILLEMEA